jgi:hypothetical protein
VPSSLGLVLFGEKPELWSGDPVQSGSLDDCVVDNAARAVACRRGDAVVVFRRPVSN